MKKFVFILFVIFISSLLLYSCKNSEIDYGNMEQDNLFNGNLSFYYDNLTHVGIFGSENEIIQFYQKDEINGLLNSGYRVGITITAPKSINDIESGYAIINNKEIKSNQYLIFANNVPIGQAKFYIEFDSDKKDAKIEIKWNENTQVQTYYVKLNDNVIFDDN